MNTILASNLSAKGCNEANLNNYFSAIGPLTKIIIDTGAKSARIAFKNAGDAQKAILHNGKWFLGASLQLSMAPQSISLKRSRSRSPARKRMSRSPARRSRSRSRSPKRRRSRSISRSRSRSLSRSPARRSRSRSFSPRRRISRSRSRSRSPAYDRQRWAQRSPSPRRRSRSASPVNRASVCLTDLLEGTSDEIIRNAVIESMNNTTEPFTINDISSIVLDNNNNMALITFRDPSFAIKFKQQGNLMLFSRLIPICDVYTWKGELGFNRSGATISRKFIETSDHKALEALFDPATLQYIKDTLKCDIQPYITIEITLQGPNKKAIQDAHEALNNSAKQRFNTIDIMDQQP